MKEQLLSLGIEEEKICYKEELNRLLGGTVPIQYGRDIEKYEGTKIAIVPTDMDYNGGTMAAIYAAHALKTKGYAVCMIVPGANEVLIESIVKMDISLYVYSALPYMDKAEIGCIESCDAVIVNVFQMLRCVCGISKIKPTIWWIHEASDRTSFLYTRTKRLHPQYADVRNFEKANIYAVSKIALDAFHEQYPDRTVKTLTFGVPDERVIEGVKTEKKIFAIIGAISELKNQLFFLEGLKRLSEKERSQIECWLIGKCGNSSYAKQFLEVAKLFPQVKLCGEMNREELKEAFKW